MLFLINPFDNLSYYDNHYDSSANLLYMHQNKIPFPVRILPSDTNYVHPIHYSVEYAYLLLKRNEGKDIQRACDILNTILSFQDMDKKNFSYGLFPEYAEDPVCHDYFRNSVPRFTIVMLQILEECSELIPEELISDIKNSCYATAFHFSLEDQPVTLPVTHTVLYETYILFQCTKLFGNINFSNLAHILLNSYYAGTLNNSAFWEYNSIYEVYITSELLMKIKKDIPDTDITTIIDSLYDLLWSHIAKNFHSKMYCLTGPKTNISVLFPEEQFTLFIKSATGQSQKNSPKNIIPILSRCPEKYLFMFSMRQPKNFIQQLNSRGATVTAFFNSQVATNYIQPDYSIGSLNCSEFWSSHLPVIGYCISDSSANPYKFGVQVLNNDHLFSSAKLNSVQHNGCVLGHISLLTNRGDQHLTLDLTNEKIITHDFRIRFYITGNIKLLRITSTKNSLKLQYKNTVINYSVPFIKTDDLPIKFEMTRKKASLYFDAVIVKSEKDVVFEMKKFETAVCQFLLQVNSLNEETHESDYSIENSIITGKVNIDEHELMLKTLCKPDYFEYANCNDAQFINGVELAKHATYNSLRINQYQLMVSPKNNITNPFGNYDHTLDELKNIDKVDFMDLFRFIKKILDSLKKENYTLGIFKQYSIQIIKTLFSKAIEQSFQFEDIINNRYFGIYQTISNSSSHDSVYNLILTITENIVKDYVYIKYQPEKKNIISDIIDIIERNYQDPSLSLSYVSSTVGVSESYISRVFKKKTNTSYIKQVIRIRIEKSKELLLKGVPVEEAAPACGYVCLSSFNRAFKQYTGMTVKAWLNQSQPAK